MAIIAKRFLVASFIYLVLGLVAQTGAVFDVWLGFNPLAYTSVAATQQLLLMGWLTQAALAVIYDRWLVSPGGTAASSRSTSRAASRLSDRSSDQLAFILFNVGLPLVILGQPGLSMFGGGWFAVLAVLGAVLQLLAGLIFAGRAWSVLRATPR
jgi:hypothetical protein